MPSLSDVIKLTATRNYMLKQEKSQMHVQLSVWKTLPNENSRWEKKWVVKSEVAE